MQRHTMLLFDTVSCNIEILASTSLPLTGNDQLNKSISEMDNRMVLKKTLKVL